MSAESQETVFFCFKIWGTVNRPPQVPVWLWYHCIHWVHHRFAEVCSDTQLLLLTRGPTVGTPPQHQCHPTGHRKRFPTCRHGTPPHDPQSLPGLPPVSKGCLCLTKKQWNSNWAKNIQVIYDVVHADTAMMNKQILCPDLNIMEFIYLYRYNEIKYILADAMVLSIVCLFCIVFGALFSP